MRKFTFFVSTAILFGVISFTKNPTSFTPDVCKDIANISGITSVSSIKDFLRLTSTDDGLIKLSEASSYTIDVLKQARTI